MDSTPDSSDSEKQDARLVVKIHYNRFMMHMRQNRTLWAIAFSIMAFGFILWQGAESELGQSLLVFLGAVVAVIFLPTEPYRVWDLTDQQLADVVPPSHLDRTFKNLYSSVLLQEKSPLPDRDRERLAVEALRDLRRVSGPSDLPSSVGAARVAIGLDYSIKIRPFGPNRDDWVVSTDISTKRCVPGRDTISLSYCSDSTALDHENAHYGCLCREVVPLEDNEGIDAWFERVRSDKFRPSLRVQGRQASVASIEAHLIDGSGIVRFTFECPEVAEDFCQLKFHYSFTASSMALNLFPVVFSSYRCIGPVEVNFELFDADSTIQMIDFMSLGDQPATTSRAEVVEHLTGDVSQLRQIYVPEQSVLPAGAGVVFLWRTPDNPLLSDTRNAPAEDLAAIEEALDSADSFHAPMPAIPDLPEARQPIDEGGAALEPLVELQARPGLSIVDAYAELGVLDPRPIRVRRGVATRLVEVVDTLQSISQRLGVAVLDGHRSKAEQEDLLTYYRRLGPTEGYVSEIDPDGPRAPHLTGGAVDLTLTWDGIPYGLGTDFDSFSELAHLDRLDGRGAAFSDLTLSGRLRRVLAGVMLAHDFAPYPLEWWHWSFGDDVWATFMPGRRTLYDEVPRPDELEVESGMP